MYRQPGSNYGLSSPPGHSKTKDHPHPHPHAHQQQEQQQGQQQATLYAYAPLPAPSPSSQGPMYTRLGQNIVAAVNDMTPSPADVQVRQVLMQLVTEACHGALPQYAHSMQVKPFGSFVSGLGTHDSDLDLVVTGVMEPAYGERFYGKPERPVVASFLDKIARALRQCRALKISKLLTIRHARMPVSKIDFTMIPDALPYHQRKLLPSGCPTWKVSMDISVATDSGPQAARHLAQQARAYPSMRPLGLIIKTYLKALDLNDVARGGLSSYGLMYMVIAHIMAEQQEGGSVQDLAWLLHRFFIRYGYDFDTHTQTVSTKHGGIVHRTKVPGMKYDNMDRICCIDPLTGHDCTEGAFASERVLSAFEGAASFLDRQVDKYIQGCPSGQNILDELLRLRGYFTENGWKYGSDDFDDTYSEPPAKLLRTAQGDVATGSNGSRQGKHESQGGSEPTQGQMYGYQYPDAHTQAGLDAGLSPAQAGVTAETMSGHTADGAKRGGSNAMKGAGIHTGAGHAAPHHTPDAAHRPAATTGTTGTPHIAHKPAGTSTSTTPAPGSTSSMRSGKAGSGPGAVVLHGSYITGREVALAVRPSANERQHQGSKDIRSGTGTAMHSTSNNSSSGGYRYVEVPVVQPHTRHGQAERPLKAQPQKIDIQAAGQSSSRGYNKDAGPAGQGFTVSPAKDRVYNQDGSSTGHGSAVSPARGRPHVGKHMSAIHIPGVGHVAGWSGQGSRGVQQGPGRSPGKQPHSGKRQRGWDV